MYFSYFFHLLYSHLYFSTTIYYVNCYYFRCMELVTHLTRLGATCFMLWSPAVNTRLSFRAKTSGDGPGTQYLSSSSPGQQVRPHPYILATLRRRDWIGPGPILCIIKASYANDMTELILLQQFLCI